MIKRPYILRFFARSDRMNKSVSFQDLVEVFELSSEAACGHLARLWRDRLVMDVSSGHRRFKFRLERGESIMHLRFCLTPRGWQRFRWYEKQRVNRGPVFR